MDEDKELRFILGGRIHRASQRSIKERLADITPDRISKHYVMIGNRAYPIKQVLSVGLGVPLLSFTSQRAHAYLSRLGFELGEVNDVGGIATAMQSQEQSSDRLPAQLGMRAADRPDDSYIANVFAPDGSRWQVWFRRDDDGRYAFETVTRYRNDNEAQRVIE